MDRALLACVIAFASFFQTATAGAVAADLATIADGAIVDDDGDGFDSIDDRSLQVAFVDNGVLVRITRSAAEFDLEALPADASVESIVLEVRQVSIGSSHGPFEVWGYVGDGSLSLGDATAGATLLATGIASPNGPVSVEVTSFVSSLMAGDERYAGFVLKGVHESRWSDLLGFFHSTEYREFVDRDVNPVNASVLRFRAVPEPSTHVVILGALALFAASARGAGSARTDRSRARRREAR